jgi:hypothetical protein
VGPTFSRRWFYLLLLLIVLAGVFALAAFIDRQMEPENALLWFSPAAGAFEGDQLVEIHPSRSGTPIIFTTNGAVPTTSVGALYEHPLLLDSQFPDVTVIRAREFADGELGPIQNASYVVGLQHELPILSIIADPTDLWDQEIGLLANPWQRGQEWERPVHITYFEGDRGASFEIPAGVRIYDDELPSAASSALSDDLYKPSFKVYFRQEYDAARLEYPLFPEHEQDIQSFKRLLLLAGDRSGRWTLLEDQLQSEIASQVDGFGAQGRPVLLFINGEPWGIYRLSEEIDRFFLEDNMGIVSPDVIQGGRAEEGDSQSWDTLMGELGASDLSSDDVFSRFQAEVDLESLGDHSIIQMFFGRTGNSLSAVRPQGAQQRWFWMYGNSRREGQRSLEHTDLGLLEPSDSPDDVSLLLRSALENPGYRAYFARRTADLLNTVLAPQTLEAHIDRYADRLRPDIDIEAARWPAFSATEAAPDHQDTDVGDETEWERNVETLREFVRGRPAQLRQQLVDELELRGTDTVSFDTSGGDGYVVVNGFPFHELPWQGTYFLDTEIQVIAVPEPGYAFAGWEGCVSPICQEPPNGSSSSVISLTVEGSPSITARFAPLPADDAYLRPNDVIINEYWINDDGTRYASIGGYSIEGDWLELLVTRKGSIDLRGWRITDNDTKISTSEGSIILPNSDVFAAVPHNTALLIIASENNANEARFWRDDLDPGDGQMVLYAGNGLLDVSTDAGFGIGTGDENLVLLAPGPSASFADDIGIDFVAEGSTVTPFSFGVLADGVTFEAPFQGLGNDDGVVFSQSRDNDHGDIGWIVDPAATQSGDDPRPGATNILTPGALNYGQSGLSIPPAALALALMATVGLTAVLYLRAKRR